MENLKYSKEQVILIFLFITSFIILAGYNYIKLSHLKKYGVIETVIVNSYSLETKTSSRKGISKYHYKAKIEYHLQDDDVIQICNLDFRPSDEYYENKKIEIIRNPKNGFKLPINEINTFKKNKIHEYIIFIIAFILIMFLAGKFKIDNHSQGALS